MPQPQITWIGSPNFDTGRNGHTVKAIVLHGTGTPGTLQPGIGDVDSTFAQDGGVSTHFAVDRNGNIHQYVKTSDVAYGNGIVDSVGPDPSVGWLMDNWRKRVNPNLETISIETKNDSSNAQPLTEPQYQAVLWLVCKLLTENPQIQLDRHSGILGHYQIQQIGRAKCPGPNFPWDRLMKDLKAANIPQNKNIGGNNSVPTDQPQTDPNVIKQSETGQEIYIINDGDAKFADKYRATPFECIGFARSPMFWSDERSRTVQYFDKLLMELDPASKRVQFANLGLEAWQAVQAAKK